MFNVAQIGNWIKAQQANRASPDAVALFSSLKVTGIATLKDAGPNDVAFFFSKHYLNDLLQTKAGLIVTGNEFVKPLEDAKLPQWSTSVFLACANPYSAMATVTAEFSKVISTHDHQSYPESTTIHSSASVSSSVKIGKQVSIGAYVVIEPGVTLQDGVVIYPHCYVGADSIIGEGTVLFPRVTIYERTLIGRSCRIHAGAVIGSDGFGYAPVIDPATKLPIDHQKIFHLGRVVIDDFVEIGANTTVDRGTLGDTRIHSKAKIDNLVQIAHNCEVGEGSIMCGAAAISGSSSLGKFVTMGGQSGLANQVHVGDYAKMSAYSGSAKDVEPHAEMAGIPARALSDQYKILAIQNKMLRERRKK